MPNHRWRLTRKPLLGVGQPLWRPPKAGAPQSSLWSAAVAASEGQCLGSCPRSAKISMSSQDDLGPNRHCGPDLKLQDQAGDGPLEWVRPPPKAPERSWHASGPSFRPNRRFSTHFGPNLVFLAGKPDPLSETSTSVLSQQQTSVPVSYTHLTLPTICSV